MTVSMLAKIIYFIFLSIRHTLENMESKLDLANLGSHETFVYICISIKMYYIS